MQLIEDIQAWMNTNADIQVDALTQILENQNYTEKQSFHILLAITEFTSLKNSMYKEVKDIVIKYSSAVEYYLRQTDLYLKNSPKPAKIQKALSKASRGSDFNNIQQHLSYAKL